MKKSQQLYQQRKERNEHFQILENAVGDLHCQEKTERG